MKIIGIDPGSIKTGFGIIEFDGYQLEYINSGVIKVSSRKPVQQRLVVIYNSLLDILNTYSPDVASFEDIFSYKNPKSALYLGYARGVALLGVTISGIPVYSYAPSVVKQIITGNGRASKKQIKEAIKTILNLKGTISEDASDALAIAICHAYNRIKNSLTYSNLM